MAADAVDRPKGGRMHAERVGDARQQVGVARRDNAEAELVANRTKVILCSVDIEVGKRKQQTIVQWLIRNFIESTPITVTMTV